MDTTEHLTTLLREKYILLHEAGTDCIDPAYLATYVVDTLDPTKAAPFLVRWAAILELRQLARAVCRRWYVEDAHRAEQGNLFDFQLQPRYPATRVIDGEKREVYVLRMKLSYEERLENYQRMSREIDAKTVHRDALWAETELLVRSGQLSVPEQQPQES